MRIRRLSTVSQLHRVAIFIFGYSGLLLHQDRELAILPHYLSRPIHETCSLLMFVARESKYTWYEAQEIGPRRLGLLFGQPISPGQILELHKPPTCNDKKELR